MSYIGGGGGGESEGLEVGEEVWSAAPPWVTGTHQQYAVLEAILEKAENLDFTRANLA